MTSRKVKYLVLKSGVNIFLLAFALLNAFAFIEFICKVYEENREIKVGIPLVFYQEILLSDGRNHSFRMGYFMVDLIFWIIFILFTYRMIKVDRKSVGKHKK